MQCINIISLHGLRNGVLFPQQTRVDNIVEVLSVYERVCSMYRFGTDEGK